MATIYQFGKFVLNTQEQTLSADGQVIHLPTKEFETLQMLVENNGKILSKDEMMSAIWKDTFVEESNLAQYVSRLRKILNADGNQYIKTISKRGYRFSADVTTSDGDLVIERHMRVKVGGNETRSLGEINSVAVLPFQSLASQADDEFFGLGITDALITQLTRTGKVITRPTASVLKFKSADQDPIEIAEMLNVDAILQGNFQRAGNRMRLTAQMLDAESGKTLWAESFNTDIDDIFDVQDRIAERIVNAFSKQHSAETQDKLTKRYTENKEAYQEYLQGRVHFSKRTADGLTKALKHFEAAIEIDPLYALAYAGIADVYQLLPLSDEMEPHSAFPKAKAAVLRALEIDDAIPEAHTSLAVVLMNYDWNWEGAELSFQKAIDLNPNYAAAHQVYGTLLLRLGRVGDAIIELKKAQTLDPLSPAINTWMAEAFAHLGEHEAAIRIHKETLKFAPEYSLAYYHLVQSYVSTGRFSEAVEAAENAIKLSDDVSLTRLASIFLKAQTGDREAARSELQMLIDKKRQKYLSAANIAGGFAVLNEPDEVFKWLNTALDERDSNLTWLNTDREFDDLRGDPRFREILRQVNLLDENAAPSDRPVSDVEIVTRETDAPKPRPRRTWTTFAAVVAAAVLGFAGYYLIPILGVRSAKPIEKNTLIRLTDAPLDEISPTFTRDGQIRFARFIDKKTIVSYIMNADGTGVREETAIPGLSNGAWSPDGTKVFYHKAAGDPNFYLANADGSDEKVMPFHPGNSQWSPDSKQFLYQAKTKDSIPNNADIYIYTLETGTTTPAVESLFFDSDPSFSPDGKTILYVSDIEGNFEIYSKVIATGETKRLTNNPGHESFPTYSPDGTQIIFNSDREKENNDVYLMNADGGNVKKITDGPGWDAAPPNSWSPDGTQVLLQSDRSGKENIYVMNIEPFVPRRVAANVESDQPLDLSYSPNGDQIVYAIADEIRIFDVNSQIDRFVFKTSMAGYPAFSPDGTKILFQQRIDENTEICSINSDGSGFVNVTQNQSKDVAPAYSPDGTKIAFSANRAGGLSLFEIYVMNADGSEPKLVFGDRAMSINPAWSPDGKSLVFSNDREDGRIGNFELFSINVDGGPERRLTNRPHYDVDPTFSPDGSKIVFVSNSDGNSEIYVMNADGSGQLRLTRDLGRDLFPHWSLDGKKIIFTSNRTGKYAIYEIEMP
jgi:Tol biopolymer transport system component/TolB-like protein